MVYVEAPNVVESSLKSIFLAGSISKAMNWQMLLIDKIRDINAVVYNPRRVLFPKNDPDVAEKQITWEHTHLKKSTVISFWFSSETVAPITLFELGRWLTEKPIVIGVDPGYPRKADVEVQVSLERPEIHIVYSIDNLANEIFSIMEQVQFV